MSFTIGEMVRVAAVFLDDEGVEADPTAVNFQFRDPEGEITSDNGMANNGTEGHFDGDINITMPGTWKWKFTATGDGQAAIKGEFTVDDDEFS